MSNTCRWHYPEVGAAQGETIGLFDMHKLSTLCEYKLTRRNARKQGTKCRKWPKRRSHLTATLTFYSVLHGYSLYYFRLVDVKTSVKRRCEVTSVHHQSGRKLPLGSLRKSTKSTFSVHFLTLWIGILATILFSTWYYSSYIPHSLAEMKNSSVSSFSPFWLLRVVPLIFGPKSVVSAISTLLLVRFQ